MVMLNDHQKLDTSNKIRPSTVQTHLGNLPESNPMSNNLNTFKIQNLQHMNIHEESKEVAKHQKLTS